MLRYSPYLSPLGDASVHCKLLPLSDVELTRGIVTGAPIRHLAQSLQTMSITVRMGGLMANSRMRSLSSRVATNWRVRRAA